MNLETEVAVMKNDLEYIKTKLDSMDEGIRCIGDTKADKSELLNIRNIVYAMVGYTLTLSVGILTFLLIGK